MIKCIDNLSLMQQTYLEIVESLESTLKKSNLYKDISIKIKEKLERLNKDLDNFGEFIATCYIYQEKIDLFEENENFSNSELYKKSLKKNLKKISEYEKNIRKKIEDVYEIFPIRNFNYSLQELKIPLQKNHPFKNLESFYSQN